MIPGMPTNPAFAHYAILTAMLAPAFFLTATASLLMSANQRLARVIDRLRTVLKELEETSDPEYRSVLERRIEIQRLRSRLVLRGSQLLYAAISFFVGTSLSVAADAIGDQADLFEMAALGDFFRAKVRE